MDLNRSAKWQWQQRAFWDNCAVDYSALYNDVWSSLEDDQVLTILTSITDGSGLILDIGCGQALAFGLLRKACSRRAIRYIGVDISGEMLKHGRERYGETVQLIQGDMDRLPIRDGGAATVISINSAMSYAYDLHRPLAEVSRVLAPGGRYIVMCLSRWSMSRLVRFKFSETDSYGTGQYSSELAIPAAPVRFYSKSALLDSLSRCGLDNQLILGQSAIRWSRDTCSLPWRLSAGIGRMLPDLGHSFIAVGLKRP